MHVTISRGELQEMVRDAVWSRYGLRVAVDEVDIDHDAEVSIFMGDGARPKGPPKVLGMTDADITDHEYFQARFSRLLTAVEADRATGCIGYALREEVRGEDLTFHLHTAPDGRSVLHFHYDWTKSRSDDPDIGAAIAKAIHYLREGTPIRLSDRAGAGTKGTRLVEGIGDYGVQFTVEVDR